MFSFKKVGQKVLNRVLNANSPHIFEQFFQHIGLKKAQWVSLTINQKTIAESIFTKELEIHTATDAFSLKCAKKGETWLLKLWQNQLSQGQIQVLPTSQILPEFNHLIEKLIGEEIFIFQTTLNNSLSTTPFRTTEISQDEKALEWMKVSFIVLEKAVIESLTNANYIFQLSLFFGINPKSGLHEIRLILFNLDIKMELLANGSLRIKIYNDKDQAFGSSQKAALIGDYNFRKREMLDELTKLLSVVTPGIKF